MFYRKSTLNFHLPLLYRFLSALLLVAVAACIEVEADILLNFDNGTTNPSVTDANLGISVTPGANATVTDSSSANDSNGLEALGSMAGTGPASDALGDFHTIALTASNLADNQTLDIESFKFGWGANNPLNFTMAVFSDLTGFDSGSELASHAFTYQDLDVTPRDNLISVDLTDSGFRGLSNGDTVEFRIYFSDTSNSAGRQHILDDLEIVTTVNGAAPARHYQVYLIGGQSNGWGFGDPSELPADLQAPQTDVLFYSDQLLPEPNTLTSLQPGSGSNGRFGPEITFGRTMADTFPDQNFAIIKHSPGSTSLNFHWDPTPETTDIATSGPAVEEGSVYEDFKTVVSNGLAALHAAGHTTEVAGMLWIQGESDTGLRLQYEPLLNEFIADVRSVYGADLPFFISELSPNQLANRVRAPGSPPPEAAFDGIRLAQQLVAAGDLNTYLIQTIGPEFPAPDIHFRTVAQVNIGEGFAQAVIERKAELIVNGNFEVPFVEADTDQPNDPTVVIDFPANGFQSVDLPNGWQAVGETVLVNGFDNFDAGENAVPSSGVNFLQLQSNSNAPAVISQTIQTVVGQEYSLSFDYSALDFNSRDMSIPYQIADDTYHVDLTSLDFQLPWATETRPFVATATSTTIRFTGFSFSGFWGPSVDNVSVSPVATTVYAFGDVNRDGSVNFFDIAPFIALLTNDGVQREADIDQNDVVNFFDIAPFIELLNN